MLGTDEAKFSADKLDNLKAYRLKAQDYKDNCPYCKNSMYFDLTEDGMSKGIWCNKYSILIQDDNKENKKYVCVTGKNHTECAIIKQKKINAKLKKCH